MQAKDDPNPRLPAAADAGDGTARRASAAGSESRPLLMVDIDGVISLFGGDSRLPLAGQADPCGSDLPRGSFHSIEGMPHFLSAQAAGHLLDLWPAFELVWASGWEEKANEHLPHLLGLPSPLPYLSFDRGVGGSRLTNAHWKLDAIEAYAGSRPLAWIDDAFNDACHEWAGARQAPTLLVQTEPHAGLTEREAKQLADWAGRHASGMPTT